MRAIQPFSRDLFISILFYALCVLASRHAAAVPASSEPVTTGVIKTLILKLDTGKMKAFGLTNTDVETSLHEQGVELVAEAGSSDTYRMSLSSELAGIRLMVYAGKDGKKVPLDTIAKVEEAR